MSLQVWLPLTEDLRNQGLSNVTVTNQGATLKSAGKLGGCYTGRIDVSSSIIPTTLNGSEFTVAFWIYINEVPTSSSVAETYVMACGTAGTRTQFHIAIRANGAGFAFCFYSDDYTFYSTVTDKVEKWMHVVCAFKSNTQIVYVDGTKVGERATGGGLNVAANSILNIYAAHERLNDFRIYDHCLSQAEIHEIAKGKMIHLKLANNGFGNPNLIIRSTFMSAPWATAITGTETYKGKDAITVRNSTLYTQTSNGTTSIFPAITFAASTQYTLSLDWCDHLRSDGLNSALYLRFKYSDGTYSNVISPTSNPDANWTHVKLTSTAGKTIAMMTTTYGNGGVVSIANLKLEVGAQETAYSPPTNELDNVEYDCSGYRHDATKNAITPVFDSARYGAAAVFNGSSSYIKINDNTWMADRMPAMTINVWAKVASSWPAAARIFSCTEGGGFNCEAGDSGYWRFPVHVYTSATETSVAYKFDSKEIKLSDLPVGEWVMLTWVYDNFGTRTYINGELHHTYINNSYGIHFNTGARLFLGCEANAANPSSPWYNGQMSDFRIYATAMSQADIRLLYRASGFVDNEGNVFAGELREV